jgi:hypothetical protein
MCDTHLNIFTVIGVILLSVIMLSVVTLCVIAMIVILLSVIMISVMLSAIKLSVITMRAIVMSVVAPLNIKCSVLLRVNIMKLFSSSMTVAQRKLECFSEESIFRLV